MARAPVSSSAAGPLRWVFLACAVVAGAAAAEGQDPAPGPPAGAGPSAGEGSPPGPAAPPAGKPNEQGALLSEESVARLHDVLRRRPLHGPAFNDLVKHFTERGRLEDLVREYEKLVEGVPDDAPSRIVLARLYLRAGQAEKAAGALEALGPLEGPLRTEADKLLVLRSEVYQRLGKVEEARGMLRQAFGGAASTAERLKLSEALADSFLQTNERDRAAEALVRLVAEFPDQYFHRKRIADALAQRDLHAQALDQYREVLRLVATETDKRCEVLRQMGRSLERLGKRTEAIEAYTQALGLLHADHWMFRELHERVVDLYRAADRLDDLVTFCHEQVARSPEQTSLRSLLAEVLAAAKRGDEAKQVLADAVGLFPKDRSLSRGRVQVLERLNDREGVAAEYERILAQFPDEPELYIDYGLFLARAEKLSAARGQWKRVLDRSVTDAALALRLGSLFEQFEMLDDAAGCYERAIAIQPVHSDGYTALARLWFFRGEKEKAVAALRRMAEAGGSDAALQAELAQAFLGMALPEEALVAMRRACELDPGQVRYRTALADLLLHAGKVDDSLRARRELLDRITDPHQQVQAMDVLVSLSTSSGKLAELREAERKALAADPAHPVRRLLLARIADAERDFAAQREHLETLLKAHPGHEEGRRFLARLDEAVGDIDAAVRGYRTLIEQHPARARLYYEAIADLKMRYHDKAGAVEVFEEMARASSRNATLLKAVAEQMLRLDEEARALGHYERALQLQPDWAEVRLAYGKALHKAGRLEDALSAFKAAALQQGDRETAAEALGRLHETAGQLGELDRLLAELQTSVEESPGQTGPARMLADLYIREFEYGRAMDLLDLLLKHYPRDAELRLTRADLLRRLARFDDALAEQRAALRLSGVDADYVLGEMGKTAFEGGRVDQARQTWRRVQNRLYAGTLLRNNGLLGDAVEVFREGIRLKPDDFALHRNLVQALQQAGKDDEALEAARRLLDFEPDNVINIEDLARAHLARGDRAAAAEVAGRLFSANVAQKQPPAAGPSGTPSRMGLRAVGMTQAWGRWGGAAPRNNLERAVHFFREQGLMAELETVVAAQMKVQPGNALLRLTASHLYEGEFAKPALALELLRELETAAFPVEQQMWLGQGPQRDYFRLLQYRLIGSKPALRDARLQALEARPPEARTRDELLELAIIRQSQGAHDQALPLLTQAAAKDAEDLVALGALVDALVRAERFADAEPHARDLVRRLEARNPALLDETVERIRRDFIRTLPLQLQIRVNDALLRDLARKWSAGQALMGGYGESFQLTGYARAQLTLATICAKTGRMDEARAIWKSMEPTHPADVDGWTLLAAVVQTHDQQDLAFQYYEQGLRAARALVGDPLLSQVFGTAFEALWYGEGEGIDTSFNKIVEAFAARDRLMELYDFLRETDQLGRSRRLAERYKLHERLAERYRARVEEARREFQRSPDDPFQRSVPYFMHVAKLAEVLDQAGRWPEALAAYKRYLEDFPDEMGLVMTLGEVSEAGGDTADALEWEKKAAACKERLARQVRRWDLREILMTPSPPRALPQEQRNRWGWMERWKGRSWWGYGQRQDPLALWPSWLRIAQLHIALGNALAAGDALQRAVEHAGGERDAVTDKILTLIQGRQLTGSMLPVLRSLAVHQPLNQAVQIVFADSLEQNAKGSAAAEVYRRMLRRGVSDLGTLARVRGALERLDPKGAAETQATLASLEAEAAADAQNANLLLRLAKAYYYSLRIDPALETLRRIEKIAPHLAGVQDLLVEIHTLRGESEPLVGALRAKVQRATDEGERAAARRRLVEELILLGRVEEALEEVRKLVTPADPSSYVSVGNFLQYFGRNDEAAQVMAQAGRSQRWGRNADTEAALVRALALKGDVEAAADKMLEAVDTQMQQATQRGGWGRLYGGRSHGDPFEPYGSLFVLYPTLQQSVEKRLLARQEKDPANRQVMRLLMEWHRRLGRRDRAEALLERIHAGGAGDHEMVMSQVDRAIERREFDKALALAQRWLAEQPKPALPPGIPPQYAGMMNLVSERNLTQCKIGDIYWKMGDPEKAFAAYRGIVDEKVDVTRVAYAALCAMRGRVDEARSIVDAALGQQAIPPAPLLQFRALLSLLSGDAPRAFDDMLRAAEAAGDEEGDASGFGSRGDPEGQARTLHALAQQTGLLDRYFEFLRKRLDKNPNAWENHLRVAAAYRHAGRVREAFEVLDAAQKMKSLEREALTLRASWLERDATPETLIPLYERLIELSERKVSRAGLSVDRYFGSGSGDVEAVDTSGLRGRLGELLWDRGDRDQAVKTWTARLNMKEAGGHVALAQRFLAKEAYDQAEAALRKALELDPADTFVRQSLADLAHARNDIPTAFGHIREIFLSLVGNVRQLADPRENVLFQGDSPLLQWAVDIVRSPAAAAGAEKGEGAGALETRLLLALLGGDWKAAAPVLERLRQVSPYDSLVWILDLRDRTRRGRWTEAIEVCERLVRLQKTTIADHRDQLKLVLAGKQIRVAEGGERRAPTAAAGAPGASAATSPNFGYRSWSGRSWESSGGGANQLATLYMRAKQYDRAERLYLLGNLDQARWGLSSLAGVVREQGAAARALDLYRLAYVVSGDDDLAPDIAEALRDAGRPREAVDLLVRAYRLASRQDEDRWRYSMMSAFYGGYGQGVEEPQLEDNRLHRVSEALHDTLRRSGLYDAVLGELSAAFRAEPQEARVGVLVSRLQAAEGRWTEARDTLAALVQAHPTEGAFRMALLRAHLQSGDPESARAQLKDLRERFPGMRGRWALYEAFTHLLQSKPDAAVQAVEPLLAKPNLPFPGVEPRQVMALLIATGKTDRLVTFLEARRKSGMADPDEGAQLARLYLHAKRWHEAARLALEAFWREAAPLERTDGYRLLARAVRAGGEAAAGPAFERPEDRALLALLARGPAAGREAFQRLVESTPDSVDARRGLALATFLGDDGRAALDANRALLDWLASRRDEIWRPAETFPLADRAAASLEQLRSSDTLDSATVLGTSMSFAQHIGSLVEQSGRTARAPKKYEELWQAHQDLQGDILLHLGDAEAYIKHVRAQSERPGAGRDDMEDYEGYSSRYMGRSHVWSRHAYRRLRRGPSWEEPYGQGGAGGWREAVAEGLARYRRFEPLAAHLDGQGPRLSNGDWLRLSEACAALGRDADARSWRRKWFDDRMIRLRLSDVPKLPDVEYGYRWYESLEERIRGELPVSTAGPDPEDDEGRRPEGYAAPLDEPWELAAADPDCGPDLAALADIVGDAWGGTPTLQNLIGYHRLRRAPGDIVMLLERVSGADGLLRSPHIADYLKACYASRDFDRVDRLLQEIAARGPGLKDALDLERLMVLRLREKRQEADALERDLLARCRAEKYAPVQPGTQGWDGADAMEDAADDDEDSTRRWRRLRLSRNEYSSMLTVRGLAEGLGLRYDMGRPDRELSVGGIAGAYAGHGLFRDALRLVDRLVAEIPAGAERARLSTLGLKAEWLRRAGDAEAARRVSHEVEAALLRQVKADPARVTAHGALSALYASKEFGPDDARALEEHREARRLDPAFDADGVREAELLHRLGRHAEAWKMYEEAARRGELGGEDAQAGDLYRAGLSGLKAGAGEAARVCLRQALWRDPLHRLAEDARRSLQEAPK